MNYFLERGTALLLSPTKEKSSFPAHRASGRFSRVQPPPPTPADMNSPPAGPSLLLRQPPAVPDYELLRCIGHGSYGDVWLARNVLGQLRAVKFVYRSRFSDPRPFEREFEGIQRFEPISRSHPSQLAILHVGKNDAEGCFYYVMELADDAEKPKTEIRSPKEIRNPNAGNATISREFTASDLVLPSTFDICDSSLYSPHTLRYDLEHQGRLPIADCIQIGLSLSTALAYLHEQGLVHRDIKPSNVVYVNGVAKLGDIGLVTDAGDTQSIVGTEGYLPPEGPGTPQADIYSLGKVLYEISTGMDRRRFAELPDDVWTWPDRAAVIEFNEIVLKACVKDSAQRYSSAADLRADLCLLQGGKSVKSARLNKRRRVMIKRIVVPSLLVAIAFGVVTRLNFKQQTDVATGGPPSTNEFADALCSKALANLRGDNQRGYPEVYTNLHRAIELDRILRDPTWAYWNSLRGPVCRE
ncbi:MAG: serine/threonine-protein kinase [Verrucomicrobiota bacterium]